MLDMNNNNNDNSKLSMTTEARKIKSMILATT